MNRNTQYLNVPGTVCEACKREPQLKDDPARLGYSCRKRFSTADSKAASLAGIHGDMEAAGIPLAGRRVHGLRMGF